MKKFNIKKILIPLDFSETALLALEHGAYMASLFKADIILLHVIRPNFSMYSAERMQMPVDIMKYQEESASQQLYEAVQKIRDAYAVKVETLYETGFVCSTIISVADRYQADLIIMGTHGVSGFTERFIGSNAYRVVNESNCPVITIQTHTNQIGFKDIVLPIDHSLHSSQKINHAVFLAERYSATIHILGLSHTEDKKELNKLKIKLDQIEEFMDKHGIANDKKTDIGANYAKLTINFGEQIGADLIIIMTEWDENITGLFIGPFARQIVNHSKIPVMSIRPEVKSESELAESGMLWKEVSQF